ncbi:hypothetical protein RHGRI_032728 [Rhododendron griersonianum]|uniref:Uncharacterized protein n=1 Tax=Rhododendron griersonianum TaxID=479676 RepID=A0AAV6IHR5_9ERIC|nr:hypothetical protein RHGRI_032728 [Rhododendron griersonianum]
MTLYIKIQSLQDGNIRAKIRDGQDHPAVHVHKEIQRIWAMARKGKATYVGSGKENFDASHVDYTSSTFHLKKNISPLSNTVTFLISIGIIIVT